MDSYFKNTNYYKTSSFVKYNLFNHQNPNYGQSNCLRPLMEKKKSMQVSASVAKKLNT